MRRQINPKLKIEGILLTMVNSRTNFGKEISNLLRDTYGSKIRIFDTDIPLSVRAAEISAEGKSIFVYDPKGKVAAALADVPLGANAEYTGVSDGDFHKVIYQEMMGYVLKSYLMKV